MIYLYTSWCPGFLEWEGLPRSTRNFFGTQQPRGHTNENPNMRDFCHNKQALQVINTMCVDVAKGNCHGKRRMDRDVSKENMPLPKRRRNLPKNIIITS